MGAFAGAAPSQCSVSGITVIDNAPLTAVDSRGRTKHIQLEPRQHTKRIRLFLRADSREAQSQWVSRLSAASCIGMDTDNAEDLDALAADVPPEWLADDTGGAAMASDSTAAPPLPTHWLNAFPHRCVQVLAPATDDDSVHQDDKNEEEAGECDDDAWDVYAERIAAVAAQRQGRSLLALGSAMGDSAEACSAAGNASISGNVLLVARVADAYAAGVLSRLAQALPAMALRLLVSPASHEMLDRIIEAACRDKDACC